jgi:general nucleoside transport system ATP-binding protein
MTDPFPAVELRGLSKRFGTCVANDGVNLRVERGSIHGIVGENGAGKSTAMKMLYGVFRPDAGEILVNGKERAWSSPADAIAAGIGMVHQHFMLAGPHTALDNILLGMERSRFGLINRKQARQRLGELSKEYGLHVDWDQPVEDLPVGLQQRIEILKLLYRNANILILDEPTAVLTPQETNALLENLRQLRDQGKTILLITHKLKEVIAFTDRVTVFRAGKVSGEAQTSQTSPQELANLMVGRKVLLKVEVSKAKPLSEPALEMKNLNLTGSGGRDKLSNVSFAVKRGEIVGIAGVEGNGQTELLQAMLHPRDKNCRSAGIVSFLGRDVSNWSARQIRRLGVGVIPEDRHNEGLLLDRSLAENFVLGLHRCPEFDRAGILNSRNIAASAALAMQEYDIRPAELTMRARKLSGGNQQKLIVAREFHRNPKVLIAAQPTRGVDVGAIEFIHKRIIRARDEGAGVLLVSAELDEILALSDRILVMFEGKIVGEFPRGNVDEAALGLRMAGS